MSNPNKRRGTEWETAVLRYSREHGFPRAVKPRQEGNTDIGDIHVGPLIVQAKDWQNWQAAIRQGLDGAVRQAAAAGHGVPVAVVKRARKPVGEAYAVMRLSDLLALVSEQQSRG